MTRRKGHDPVFTFRAPAEGVAEALRVGAEEGDETLSAVVRRALEEYIDKRTNARA